jgi:hypothetical protein
VRRSVRDAFFASPKFPRLLNPDSIKDTIARGVENGMLGYVGKKTDGSYAPFHWKSSLPLQDVEISDDIYLIQGEAAEAYKAGSTSAATGTSGSPGTATTTGTSGSPGTATTTGTPVTTGTSATTGTSPRRSYRRAFLASCGMEISRTKSG